ncbi:MAG TPA: hypothetical protein VK629_10750 [Steroidobacteraceae bacterium]|nr:hypothetical protein [Steroidobacteraceae bacterium]
MSERVPTLIERKELRRILRDAGLSSRSADRVVNAVWREIVGDAQAEVVAMKERLEEMQLRMRS